MHQHRGRLHQEIGLPHLLLLPLLLVLRLLRLPIRRCPTRRPLHQLPHNLLRLSQHHKPKAEHLFRQGLSNQHTSPHLPLLQRLMGHLGAMSQDHREPNNPPTRCLTRESNNRRQTTSGSSTTTILATPRTSTPRPTPMHR